MGETRSKNFNRGLTPVVFIAGAATMCLELMGSRILAPYLGTSTFVWTSLIGLVLASLSVGYWWGGLLADLDPKKSVLSVILLLAASWIAVSAFLSERVLLGIQGLHLDLRVASVAAAALLFGVPSILLGMVLPYAVRLSASGAEHAGRTVGNLSAISTAGSIVGTFLTGYVLIACFSNAVMLCLISLALILASLLVSVSAGGKAMKVFFFALVSWASFSADSYAVIPQEKNFIDTNTRYNHVRIYDLGTSDPYRVMQLNENAHSAMFLKHDGLVYAYTEFFRLGEHFKPGLSSALMIGGAGYSFPKEYLGAYPHATMDVVEIDEGVTELARKYFALKDDARLRIFHEDARTFLNRNQKKYDLIYGDAFQSYHVPFQLVTKEAAQEMYRALSDDGVIVMNLIAAVEGKKGRLTRAVVATFKTVFPQVYLYPVRDPENGETVQNLMLVALKSPAKPRFYDKEGSLNKYLYNLWIKDIPEDMPVLTDDHAPVEHYLLEALIDLRGPQRQGQK